MQVASVTSGIREQISIIPFVPISKERVWDYDSQLPLHWQIESQVPTALCVGLTIS